MMKNFLFIFFLLTIILCGCSEKDKDPIYILSETILENTEMLNFIGFDKSEMDFEFSPFVNKKAFNYQLFCYDNEGNIYFSDPQNNYSLYSYDGTEAKLLVDMPAYCLNYYDGRIYFLSEKKAINIEDQIFPEGYPFEYDIATDEISKIRDSQMNNMTVICGEIYGINTEGACYVYRYNPKMNTDEELFNSFDIKKCGEYFLTFEENSDEKLNFYLESKNDKKPFINDDIPLNGCFYFGKYYYKSQNDYAYKVIDLQSGKRKSLGEFVDYNFLNNDLYAIKNDFHLYKYDVNDFAIVDELNQYKYLYSNNKNLYGIKIEYNLSTRVMEYFFVKINEDFSIEILSRGDGK